MSSSTPKCLRKFLAREVLASQIKSHKDLDLDLLSEVRREEAAAEEDYLLHNSASQAGCEIDSIFGERLPNLQEKKASQLSLLLTTVAADKVEAEKREKANTEIEELRTELKLINQKETGELETDERELSLIGRKKEAVVKEILRLGSVEKAERVKSKSSKGLTRAKMNEELAKFPPPLTPAERLKIQREKDKAEKMVLVARLPDSSTGALTPQPRKIRTKRPAPEIDPEDLDGEERFRLFGPPKIKKRRRNEDASFKDVKVEKNPLGRWMSEIHDYYPEGGDMGGDGRGGEEGDGGGVDVREWLGKIREDPELGILLRREVMDVNKEAFRMDRMKRRREGL